MTLRPMSRVAIGIAAVAVVAAGLASPVAGAAPRVLSVQAGARHPTNRSAPYDFTRFFPSTINVHRGQTVRWTTFGFHTITFSKGNPPGPFRTDEVPGSYARPQPQIEGSACGRNGLGPCTLKSTTRFLSTGFPVFNTTPFEVKIDVPAGSYRFFCTVHPAMKGTVRVEKPGARVPTQRDIDNQIASEVRRDARLADEIFRTGQTPVSRVGADGRRVWRVLVGDETPDGHVSILSYLPTDLRIAAGDRVEYIVRDRHVQEPHTVTFPAELVGSRMPAPHGLGGQGFQIACDPDDPSAGARGVTGPWLAAPCPGTREVLYAPWMINANPAPGNRVLTRATLHDSGMLASRLAPRSFRTLPDTGRVLPQTFTAEFPAAGGFSFECSVHVDLMTGSVAAS